MAEHLRRRLLLQLRLLPSADRVWFRESREPRLRCGQRLSLHLRLMVRRKVRATPRLLHRAVSRFRCDGRGAGSGMFSANPARRNCRDAAVDHRNLLHLAHPGGAHQRRRIAKGTGENARHLQRRLGGRRGAGVFLRRRAHGTARPAQPVLVSRHSAHRAVRAHTLAASPVKSTVPPRSCGANTGTPRSFSRDSSDGQDLPATRVAGKSFCLHRDEHPRPADSRARDQDEPVHE